MEYWYCRPFHYTFCRSYHIIYFMIINLLDHSYNSVLSSSLATIVQPTILYVTPQYFNLTAEYTPPYWNDPFLAIVRERAIKGQLKQIGVTKCTNAVNSVLQSEYESSIYVETSVSHDNSTTLIDYDTYDQVFYDPFVPLYRPTDCWASALEADYQLFFNSSLMVAVVIANIIKCVVMVLMVLRFTTPTLVTRGDAIASFLSIEDPTTLGLRSIKKHRFHLSEWVFQEYNPYVSNAKRWGSSASRLKWIFSVSA